MSLPHPNFLPHSALVDGVGLVRDAVWLMTHGLIELEATEMSGAGDRSVGADVTGSGAFEAVRNRSIRRPITDEFRTVVPARSSK